MKVIKTTHVGSLPRPQEMIAKVLRKQEITRDDLRQYLSVIMEKQLSLGITYINNVLPPAEFRASATLRRHRCHGI
jgi:methionine synthase II (cobalamin-independent)